MKTLILILKGILLWSTFLSTIFVAMAIDSLSLKATMVSIVSVAILIIGCYKWITLDEAELLSGAKFFE